MHEGPEQQDNSLEEGMAEQRKSFLEANSDKFIRAAPPQIVDWDNANRRANGAPEISLNDMLFTGQYAENGGITIACDGDSMFISKDPSLDLQNQGFAKVDAYVPFSNGVNREAAPAIARFLETGAE